MGYKRMDQHMKNRPLHHRAFWMVGALTLGLLSCQMPQQQTSPTIIAAPSRGVSSTTQTTRAQKRIPSGQGLLKTSPGDREGVKNLSLRMHFEGVNSQFSTKALNCNRIENLRVRIVGVGIGDLPADGSDPVTGHLSSYVPGSCEFTASFTDIPVGNLRVVTVEAINDNGEPLSNYGLSGVVDITDGATTEGEVSFRTTPAGRIVESLFFAPNDAGKPYLSQITSAQLQTYVDTITEFDGSGGYPNYAYGFHPALIDASTLANQIISNNGDLSSPPEGSTVSRGTATLNITGLGVGSNQNIIVEDPASDFFIDPAGTNATRTISGIAPGNWMVGINHTGPDQDIILSFPENGTVNFDAGSTPPFDSNWELNSEQPETAFVNDLSRDTLENQDILGTRHGVYFYDGVSLFEWFQAGLDFENVLSVKASPFESLKYYAGTEGNGLFKKDGGDDWEKITNGPGLSDLDIHEIVLPNPGTGPDPQFIYAATSDGVIESLDGGDSFTKVNGLVTGGDFAGAMVSDLGVREPGPSFPDIERFFITIPEGPHAGVYASSTGSPGDGWVRIDVGATASAIQGQEPVSLHVNNGTDFYVMCRDGSTYTAAFSDITSNIATPTNIVWTQLVSAQAGGVTFQHLDVTGEDIVLAATSNEAQTPDFSTPPKNWGPVIPFGTGRFQSPFVNRMNSEFVSTGTDGARALTRAGIEVQFSTDWNPENTGLEGAEITAFKRVGSTIYIGTRYAGVFKSSGSFIEPLPDMPGINAQGQDPRHIYDLKVDNAGNLLALTETGVLALDNPASNTTGPWTPLTGATGLPADFKPTRMSYLNDATNMNQMLFVTSGDETATLLNRGVYRLDCDPAFGDCISQATSVPWTQVYDQPTSSITNDNEYLFIGAGPAGSSSVLESTNQGTSWSSKGNVALNSAAPIDHLLIRAGRLTAIAGTASPPFIQELDFAQDWQDISGNLALGPDQHILSVTDAIGDFLFLGLSQGGIRAIDRANSNIWYDFSTGTNNIPSQSAVGAILVDNSQAEMYAGTQGQGLYKTAAPGS